MRLMPRSGCCLVVLLVALALVCQPAQAQLNPISLFTAVVSLIKEFVATGGVPTRLWDWFLLDYVPTLLGQRPFNENGTYDQWKKYMLDDISNDDVGGSSTHDMIRRAGYLYEDHYVMTADGYITELIRLVNPKADRSRLKQPPVMLFHGGVVNPSIHVFASNIQHHPEKWPRQMEVDGPITSWNRSLGFVLANNGYDVWLIGTRGADTQNHHKNKAKALEQMLRLDYKAKNMTLGEKIIQITETPRFWAYTMDEIIAHEVPVQIDRVLNLTGAHNVTMFAFSFMTMISLPMLSTNQELAKKIHNYIVMAPIINIKDSNLLINGICRVYVRSQPEITGALLLENVITSPLSAGFLRTVGMRKIFRYTFAKFLIGIFSGSSAKYRSLLEPTVLSHILMPTSYKQVRHFCQQVIKRRYQKYDYTILRNPFVYGRPRPPRYNFGQINVKNWMLISGGTDQFSGQASVRQVLREVQPKPEVNINIDGYGHVDLLAGLDNDIRVNLPILNFLERHYYYTQPPERANGTTIKANNSSLV